MTYAWRKVLSSSDHGSHRIERLECGHSWIGKRSKPKAKRRFCRKCQAESRA